MPALAVPRPVSVDRREVVVAVQLDDLGLGKELDPLVALDLVDQVAGHRGREIGPRTPDGRSRLDAARYRAAWPAELPPPTTTTALSAHSCASAGVAA